MSRDARVPICMVVVALSAGFGGCRQSPNGADVRQAGGTTAAAATASTLPTGATRDQPDGNWEMPGRDFSGSRYSPLAEINTSNVQHLKVVTTMSTGVLHGHEGQPLVVGSTMYIVTPYPNFLYAVDLSVPGGLLKWLYAPKTNARAVGIACCDIINRGAVYANGKIVYNTLDGQTVAVDASTGKEAWRTQVGNVAIGETITGAPLTVKDKVYVGDSGAELGVRGYLAALDLGSGKILWRAYSTGSDGDVKITGATHPFYKKDQGKDLGLHSWSGDQWKLGGGTVWGWISYDPETNTLYYATANPGVWNPDLRPGDNKWSITLFARDPETGDAKWMYQFVPHDAWDYDEIMENVIVDAPVNGTPRKLLIHPGRDGFVYTMDRTTGEILKAEKYQPTNWATSIDLHTGEPQIDVSKRTHQGSVTHDICPSSTGAKDQQPSAFSTRTGYLYIPAHNVCMDYEGTQANYIAGTPYLGASVKMKPGPGASITKPGENGKRGDLVVWDPLSARQVCDVKEDLPLWSGVLVTAGDVAFYGTMDGWFKAIDARSCAPLWKFKTGSGIIGNPIAYRGPDGKQYIAVYSGIGGWMGAVAFPDLSLDDPYAALGVVGAIPDIKQKTAMGGMLYVFSL